MPRPEIIADLNCGRFDPVVPSIGLSSICDEIFVRAYAETKLLRRSGKGDPRQSRFPQESWFDGEFLVIDTETVDHRLTFGAYERYHRRKLIERAVFCSDDLPTGDPARFETLQAICTKRGERLYLLANVFSSHIWRLRKTGGTFVFFNASYDLSRLATSWRPAAATGKRGTRFANGFEFIRSFETWKDRAGKPLVGADGELQPKTVEQPFVRIRRDDRHHVRYDMGRANVLDLATLTHTLNDQTHSLPKACKAFGIEFAERPGEHDGTITEDNVAGCLYDVAKTSELLFTAGSEYDRHPIDLPPWHAQSGASLAKAYLRAFGVVPRSIVQPDFSKEHQGIAATTYFGGRVEARIVGEPMPCTYIDAVSMYPAVFTLLNLWFGQVIPARLEPEELDADALQALLDELHEDPRRLLDPTLWPQLAFFALVDPNGAVLPTRPTIPSPYISKSARAALEAARILDEQIASQEPYWRALDECGGKIIPDVLYDRTSKRWRPAGEFADIPRKLLRANRRRSPNGRVDGNIDQIAQIARTTLRDPDLTTSDILDFFAAHERPTIEAARKMVRADLASDDDGDPASHRLVTIGQVTSTKPLWYAGPDLAAAAISGEGRPRILKAWRLRPEGVQETLGSVAFRGDENDRIDPRTTNPFQRLVELRKRETGNKLDDDLRSTGYKVIANSGAYGIFVETTPEDIDPDVQRASTRVRVWGIDAFPAVVDRPERHSPLCSFSIAALVTSGARLLLSVAERLVHDAGAEVAYCDTDSLFIVSSEHGGLVPCTNGPYVLPDGRRAVRALSWAQVDAILDDLAALKAFKLDGSSFKVEKENRDEQGQRRGVWFYGTREKSYCLFVIGDDGAPIPIKTSAHTIGQYRSPYPTDRERRWIGEAWHYAVCEVLGQPMETPRWFELAATSQLTLTTRKLMDHYQKTCNPFDFLAVAQLAYPGLLRCCEAPRPSCQLYLDRATWAEQPWRCLSCGARIDPYLGDTEQSIFKSYRRVVASLAHAVELKRLRGDGAEPAPRTMRGLTIPRPVHVTSIEHMGKEVIVDPTDTPEELTAEQLGATDPLIYRDSRTKYDTLRAQIRAAGISRVAREAKVSRSIVKAFVNQRAASQSSTIAKLEAALARLGALSPVKAT